MVRWRGRKESDNIDDRRGQGGGGFGFPFPRGGRGRGGGIRIPMGRGGGRGGMGIWGILIVLAIMYFTGQLGNIFGGGAPAPQIDTTSGQGQGIPKFEVPGMPGSETAQRRVPRQRPATERPLRSDDEAARFASVIFNDTEDVWKELFPKFGKQYREPDMVLFGQYTQTACGPGQAAMGPFYCPLDQKIYLNLGFFKQLSRQFGAPGDFAQAYVIAHEVGHHVQTLLGISDAVQRAKARDPRSANKIQVRMELQADCLAGVWANRADRSKNILEPGDIDEGLNAAAQIGDDMIQKRSGQRVNPHNFTHGSAAQRQRWFKAGYESGDMRSCDTFKARQL